MPEKYEKPEVEFVELEEQDVIMMSGSGYGQDCTGSIAP